MKLPPEAIKELKALFQKKFGITLSDEKLQAEARELLTLYALSKNQPHALPQ